MSKDVSIPLGRKIRDLRRQRGWRQIDLAAHAELSKTYISELENGKREVGIQTLARVAEALDLKISDLMKAIGE